MKRLCLYPLLLSALLKELDSAHKTHESGECSVAPAGRSGGHFHRNACDLGETSDAVQEMASKVNSMVLEAENRVRMLEHERLRGAYAGLISPTRRFMRTDKIKMTIRQMLANGEGHPEHGMKVKSGKLTSCGCSLTVCCWPAPSGR